MAQMMIHLNSYKKQETWREVQKYLPADNRLNDENLPIEEWLQIGDINMHIDHYIQEKPKATILILHGVGGNGRLLSFIAIPLWRQGYEVICPDLPMYGHTIVDKTISYEDWIDCSVQVGAKYKSANTPLFVFGLSAGGMLAYQTACRLQNVAGVMATCLLDQRISKVTMETAANKSMAVIGKPFLRLSHKILGQLRLPMKFVCNMKAIVNNEDLARLLMKDPLSSDAKVTLMFLYGLLNPQIEIEAKFFDKCPVLLVHPQQDEWTDISLSRLFFDEIKGEKEIQILEGAGHFPIEEKGLRQLEEFCLAFMHNILNG